MSGYGQAQRGQIQREQALFSGALSLRRQKWVKADFPGRAAERLAGIHGLPLAAAEVLVARGHAEEEVSTFLAPSLQQQMPDPYTLRDMQPAAERLARAIMAGECIAVFGDYDVDGATSSAILKRFLALLDAPCLVHIPDRQAEGYGPNTPALLSLIKQGAQLIITVDCGTLAFEPLKAATDAGAEVIVADHHKAEAQMPAAHAVINPNRLDDDSGLGQLAAVGVTYMLVIATNRVLRDRGWYAETGKQVPDLRLFLDLVALGTVCDMVPLEGLNRAFVAQGLKVMAGRRNPGLVALSDVARMDEMPTTYHLGFLLGPRVNAGGRVGRSDLGVRLMSSDDPLECQEISKQLDRLNAERKEIEADVLQAAMAATEHQLATSQGALGAALVVAGQGWHPGVIGIVSSRLTERHQRPSVVIALEGETGKGSARSIPGVDLGAAIIDAAQQGLLIKGGGHAMAAGLTVATDAVDAFARWLEGRLASSVQASEQSRRLRIDTIVSIAGCTPQLMQQLERLAPFGLGNPAPRVMIQSATLIEAKEVGQGGHLRLVFKDRSGTSIKVMAWRAAEDSLGQAMGSGLGRRFHIAGKLKLDTWGSRPRVEMTLDDGMPAD